MSTEQKDTAIPTISTSDKEREHSSGDNKDMPSNQFTDLQNELRKSAASNDPAQVLGSIDTLQRFLATPGAQEFVEQLLKEKLQTAKEKEDLLDAKKAMEPLPTQQTESIQKDQR